MNSNPEIIKSEEDFNQTRLPMSSTHEITWTARDFNSLPKDFSLDSPPFDFQNATWCLQLHPNNSFGYAFISLYIVSISSRVPHHRLQFHLMLADSVESSVCFPVADFDENNKKNGPMKFMMKYGEGGSIDIVRVKCQVSCYGSPAEDAFSQSQLFERDTKDVRALCQNFKNLLMDGRDQDVTLKVMDKEFRAHRIILRARSPVLEAVLSHDMIEKNSGTIDIPDCDPSAFEQFLIYLYSGKVDTLDAGNMLSLYYVADKYDMGYLKEQCREFIKKSLSSSNITDVFQTALDHSDADLLRWTTDYFVKEANDILPTVEWMSFLKRNTVQANELIIKAMKNVTDLIKTAGKS